MVQSADPEEAVDSVVYRDGNPHVRGVRCDTCESVSYPVRDFCRECGTRAVTQMAFDRDATLETFSVVHVPQPGYEPPYAVGFVRLDPGNVRAFSPVETDDEYALTVDMPVRTEVTTKNDKEMWVVTPVEDK